MGGLAFAGGSNFFAVVNTTFAQPDTAQGFTGIELATTQTLRWGSDVLLTRGSAGVLAVASAIDLGFGSLLFGQTLGAADAGVKRGLSGGVEVNTGTQGAYTDFMAARFGTFQLDSDVAPTSVLYKSQDAWTNATGGNKAGGTTRVFGGIGLWEITIVSFAGLAGKTVTITINGVANILTEGVEWTAAGSNNATASSLRAAILAISGTFSSATGAVVGVVGSIGGTYSLVVTTNGAGGDITVAQSANGSVILGVNGPILTVAATVITAVAHLVVPDAIGLVFTSADTGIGRNGAGILEINSGVAGTLRDLTLRNIVAQSGYHELVAGAAPAAPAAGKARLYSDISAGKVRIMALFPSGAAQLVATEP